LPIEAVRYCLEKAEVKVEAIEHIAINRDPKANLIKKVLFAFGKRPSVGVVSDRLKKASKVRHAQRREAARGGRGRQAQRATRYAWAARQL